MHKTAATPGRWSRLLSPFSNVHKGEGARAALMLLCIFLIMTSYYVMKTAREGLILTGGTFGLRGDELKTYATGAMAILLIGIVPAYDALADRHRRIHFINLTYAMLLTSLVAFFAMGEAGLPIGFAYFVWYGLVSCFMVAQFWSYASDLYNEEQGKRLFALIATGGTLGAIAGPNIAKIASTFNLMLIGACLLVCATVLFNVIVLVLWYSDFARTPPSLEGERAQKHYEKAVSIANRTSQFVARLDREILDSMAPAQLDALQARLDKQKQKFGLTAEAAEEEGPRFEGRITVHVGDPDQAQPAVEAVLQASLKRWKMVRIERTDGEARIVYAVRPKKGQNLESISSTLTNEAAPFVASVEVERWA